jgi:Matrixin
MLIGCTSMWSYHDATAPAIYHPTIIPVWVDRDFKQSDREAIAKATDEWNFVLNGQVKLVFSGYFQSDKEAMELFEGALKTGLGIIITNSTSEDLDDDGELNGVLAFIPGTMAHHMTVVKDHIGNRELKDIVLHEFGHMLGADHTMFSSLMYPAYSNKQYPCVDKATAMQVAEVLDLNIETLRYCKTPLFP